MGSILPNPALLPPFYRNDDGAVARNQQGFPCEVRDYQVDSQQWVSDISVANQRTVGGVLRYGGPWWSRSCFFCEQGPAGCPGGTCVRSFHAMRGQFPFREKFYITQTPNNMGLGVFAGEDMFEGQLLDEYFGELIPPRVAADRHDDDYLFEIRGTCSVSARDYANWTRFVNHSCQQYNVEAIDEVLGGRKTITFRALRNIPQGEQLLIHYGHNYFGDAGNVILCTCPALPDAHIPPGQENRVIDNKQAFPGLPTQPSSTPPDITIQQKNAWVARNKRWLGRQRPNGARVWTMVHWRLLEQLIRRRQRRNDWRSKPAFSGLPSSRNDPLLALSVTTDRSQMKIYKWHLDVVKAFQRDRVCGNKGGVRWDEADLLKRIFAVNVAARRRRRRAGRRRSWARTPPRIVEEPAAPVTPGPSTPNTPAPGNNYLTPPAPAAPVTPGPSTPGPVTPGPVTPGPVTPNAPAPGNNYLTPPASGRPKSTVTPPASGRPEPTDDVDDPEMPPELLF